MEKRSLGKITEAVSLLGFGTMRYPRLDEGFDVPQLRAMFDAAMRAGVNYYDTAYVYDNGISERLLGELLVDRYPRHSLLLADKMPGWKLPDDGGPAQMRELLEESLRRMHTDYVDFYLIHSLDGESWAKLLNQGVLDFLQQMRADSRVRYLGFSFHDQPSTLPSVAEAFDWDFAQIQLNYFDWQGQQNARGQYEYLVSRGLPVISMESVRGGSLASLPQDAAAELSAAGWQGQPAELALRWVGGLPGVLTVLSGMSSLEQMEQNCRLFSDFQPLDETLLDACQRAVELLKQRDLLLCTLCKYCAESCPQHIDIPHAITGLNEYRKLENTGVLYNYLRLTKPGQRPRDCQDCGACSAVCPQKLDIPAALQELAQRLEEHHM